MSRTCRFLIALGVPLLLAGCAHDSVVMLPNEDGGAGRVTIAKRGAEAPAAVMTQPNSRATLGGGQAAVSPLGARGLRPDQTALVAALPPPARSFTLYFREGTTELTPQSAPVLDALRAEIARRPGPEVQVTGHTDTLGSGADNDALSRRRAEEILRLLAGMGFDAAIMRAVGRGERELAQPTADNVANAVNRRVEVIVR